MNQGRYTVEFITSASREIKKLPKRAQKQVRDKIEELKVDPRPPGCTKLSGRDAYRVRTGDYRIIYEINDKKVLVTVFRAGNRRDVYDAE